MVAYWVSRGRPDLHIADTLMDATAFPRPMQGQKSSLNTAVGTKLAQLGNDKFTGGTPESPKTPKATRKLPFSMHGDMDQEEASVEDEDDGENAWPRLLASAADHPDDHLAKVREDLRCGLARADSCAWL